jgi:3-hydroxyisobutyrate dehydrogenase-like beta-hydroxyacid dehydrogenase
MNIGVIGLGAMGLPIARNLLKAGHHVTVYNRTRERAEELLPDGALIADSPLEMGQNEVVISMLSDDRAVEAVVFENGDFIASLSPQTVHVSMATISAALGQRLHEAHAAQGRQYVSAPVFGRPDAAAAAKLFIVAAGAGLAVEQCAPAFDVIGQRTFYVGENPQMANLIKIMGNFMIASTLESFGEALATLRKYDVPPETFLDVLTNTLFGGAVHKNYGSIIVQERYSPPGFKLPLGLKDVNLALEAASDKSVPMPTASLIHDNLVSAMARGYSDLDWAAVALVVAENAGLSKDHRSE